MMGIVRFVVAIQRRKRVSHDPGLLNLVCASEVELVAQVR